jgi:3',5'-cyclic AMP phosphodiesterase CpdA
MADEINILHISDIHIGADLGSKHKHQYWDSPKGNAINRTLAKDLKERNSQLPKLIHHAFKKHFNSLRIDAIIITGDLVLRGSRKDEYKKAFETIELIIKELNFGNKNNIFIIPGNHEIDRKVANSKDCLDKYYTHYNNYFRGTDKVVVSTDFCTFKYRKLLSESYYKVPVSKTHLDQLQISLIPLQSSFYLNDELSAINIDWKKDRGFIEKSQIERLKEEDLANFDINIAFFHHNPLPIEESDHNYYHDIRPNTLSNGQEIIRDLNRIGVHLILHGHRHKGSIVEQIQFVEEKKNKTYIIGGAAFGHYSYEDQPGFSLININKSGREIKMIHNRIRFNPDASSKKEETVIEFHTPDKNLSGSFLCFNEGLKKLQERMFLNHSNRITMYHYHNDTKWDDAFKTFWMPITDELSKDSGKPHFKDFLNLLNVRTNETQKIKTIIDSIVKSSLENNYFQVQKIRNANLSSNLNHFRHTLISYFKNHKLSKGMFSNYLVNLHETNPRIFNYVFEPILCATSNESSFVIEKCVYFQGNNDNTPEKFLWFLYSIISTYNLKNYNLIWMPFGIANFEGDSIISIMENDASFPVNSPTTTFIGYKRDDDNPHDLNVICLEDQPMGEEYMPATIKDNLHALIKKIVYPLSVKLEELFPVVLMGNVNLELINILKTIFINDACVIKTQIDEKINQIDALFPNKISYSKNILNNNIQELKKYGIKNEYPQRYSVPWNKTDIDLIEKSL